MGSKKKAQPEATARPTFATSRLKPQAIVALTNQRGEVIKAAPGYAGAPDVQKALAVWLATAAAVGTRAQAIAAARLALTALVVAQVSDVAAWKRATQALLAAISAVCGGSAAAIQQWGFAPATRVVLAPTGVAPAGLRATYDKQLALVLRWAAVKEHLGYFVQVGDGTATGWGAAIACPKASYAPTGLAPGQKVAVRVAVQRSTGLSVWSDALSITVR
jgi:hypothetical protein